MGNSFSTRWDNYKRKQLVEDCYKIKVKDFVKDGIIDGMSGDFSFTNSLHGTFKVKAPYELETTKGKILLDGVVILKYLIRGEEIVSPLYITSSPANYGNKRYWFLCPRLRDNGETCLKKNAILYLPKNGKYFCCRACYDLTYKSVQTRDKRVSQLLKDPSKLLSILDSSTDYNNLSTEYFLGLKAILQMNKEL